jgi:D-3-phosphoglycerate dehydrogenase
VHTPGVEEIIGPRELALMKRGSILINCARGGVVNEAAIVQALSNPLDPIAFAGIDTFVDETTSVNRELLSLPQCSFSPHIGASTFDAQTRVSVDLAEGICKYFSRIDQTNLL